MYIDKHEKTNVYTILGQRNYVLDMKGVNAEPWSSFFQNNVKLSNIAYYGSYEKIHIKFESKIMGNDEIIFEVCEERFMYVP